MSQKLEDLQELEEFVVADGELKKTIKIKAPTLSTLRMAKKNCDDDPTEVVINVLRYCIRYIDSQKVVYSDLVGEGIENIFSIKQIMQAITFINNYITPSDQDSETFFQSIRTVLVDSAGNVVSTPS